MRIRTVIIEIIALEKALALASGHSIGTMSALASVLSKGFQSVAAAIGISTTALAAFLGIAAGLLAVVAIIDAITESFDEAKEKAEKSRDAYQSTADEIKSIDNELQQVESRLSELESMGKLSVVEQTEYDRLVAENEQLERQLKIKEKIAQYQAHQAAIDANNVLTKQITFDTGEYQMAYGGEYMAEYASGDIIDKVALAQKRLNKKYEDRNKLEKQYVKLQPSKSKWWQAPTEYERMTADLKTLSDEIAVIESEIAVGLEDINTQYVSLFDDNGNVVAGFEDTVKRANSVIDTAITEANEAGDAMESVAGKTRDYTAAIEDLKTKLSDFKTYQEDINSAINSSKSAIGLTKEEINTLLNYYKDLDGFDAGTLFEETANGVHLNTEELKKLNEQYSTDKMQEFADLAMQIQRDIYKQRSEGNDTSKLESELEEVRLLQNQYEGLTSAYNKWLQAKSGGKERDSYESVAASFKDMEAIKNQGWYGDESLNAYLDLLLSASQRTGDVEADFKKLTNTIDGTNHSLLDYWKFDENNALVTDGLFDFLDDVRQKMGDEFATIGSDGKYEFDFDGGKLQEVADAFGTTTEVVEMFERAMIDAGFAVDLGDLSFIEEIDRATESIKRLQEAGEVSSDLDLDFNIETDKIEDVRATIDALRTERITIDAETNPEAAAELDDLIAKCEQQYYLRLDAELDGQLSYAVSIVEQLRGLTAAPLTLEARIENSDEIHRLAAQLSEMPKSVQIAVGVYEENAGNTDAIIQQLNSKPESITVPVGFEPDTSDADAAISNLEGNNVNDKTFSVSVNDNASSVLAGIKSGIDALGDKTVSITTVHTTVNRTVTESTSSKPSKGLGGRSFGTAYADGTTSYNDFHSPINSYAYGRDWSLHTDEDALVNELGTESIVRNGRWFPIPGGAHIEQLKKGDIVFSAEQTKELIKTGRITSGGGHGKVALADGTAFNMLNLPAYDSGSGGGRRPGSGNSHPVYNGSNSYKNSGYKAPTRSDSVAAKNYAKDVKKASEANKEFEKTIDFVEIAIQRIKEAIDRVKITAESTYKTLTTRNNAISDELSLITQRINIQNQAYQKYMQAANAVGLSETWAKKVRDGSIEIALIKDENLADKIKDYQEFYGKAIEAKDAVAELHEEIADLYKDKFDNIASDYENQLSLLEHLTTTYDNKISYFEERGYLASTKYYSTMQDIERQNIQIQKEALASLINAMNEGVNSGAIKEGSEAWYEFQQEINDVKESIQESETSIVSLGNSIREVEWGHFDYLQEQISNITDEAEFLIDLMGNSKLYADNGQLTETGEATMGLHGQNYNVYMSQADRYAEEIKKLNKEIANDPNNTKLLERREELLDAQRDSILAAESEKQAIVDMVEEGINLELESLRDLIDTYNDSLDSAKNLYDYQKMVKDQTSEVARLQKQLSAYQNDTSEENRATIQKIQVDLADAMEDLEETQYDRYISEQKKLLDNMYDEYETILNQRLDNVDALISDMIDRINANSSSITDTIIAESGKVGYELSDSITSIWSNDGGAFTVISKYGDGITSALTSVNNVLNDIHSKISGMVSNSDGIDENALLAIKYSRSDGKIKAYKTGGLVDYTGMAHMDGTPDRPELVLNPEDTKNFIALKDTLRSIADGKMSIAGASKESQFNIMEHLSRINTPNNVRPTTIGDITYEINIPIEHVSDYNDFMNQMRKDGKFEKFIQSVTVDRMVGGSKLSKNKFKW